MHKCTFSTEQMQVNVKLVPKTFCFNFLMILTVNRFAEKYETCFILTHKRMISQIVNEREREEEGENNSGFYSAFGNQRFHRVSNTSTPKQ